MNIIPITFAFDNNLVMPACICISSLMMNAMPDTFYDIFILHSAMDNIDKEQLDRIPRIYPNCKITYREVSNIFDSAFEIRGITTPAYYRLLIPELIPEYDKVIYSDVDVIFRSDLSKIYNTNLDNYYLAGVQMLVPFIPDMKKYYERLTTKLELNDIIYSGNLIFNTKKIREDGVVKALKSLAVNKFKYQDLDILNIACAGRIYHVSPSFCLTSYITEFATLNPAILHRIWRKEDIEEAFANGIVHYNGQKPWKGACINQDIWWEYYRKSPFFDQKFYFDFFNRQLNLLDSLSLWKRVKTLIRYFTAGRYTD